MRFAFAVTALCQVFLCLSARAELFPVPLRALAAEGLERIEVSSKDAVEIAVATYDGGTVARIVRDPARNREILQVIRQVSGRDKLFQVPRVGRGIKAVALEFGEGTVEPDRLRGLKVVDVGCGMGRFVEDLRAFGVDAQGTDIVLSPDQKQKPWFKQADYLKLPYEDGSLDVIFETYGPSHFEQEVLMTAALKEYKRVLRPGGIARLAPIDGKKTRKLVKQVGGFSVSGEPAKGATVAYLELKKD